MVLETLFHNVDPFFSRQYAAKITTSSVSWVRSWCVFSVCLCRSGSVHIVCDSQPLALRRPFLCKILVCTCICQRVYVNMRMFKMYPRAWWIFSGWGLVVIGNTLIYLVEKSIVWRHSLRDGLQILEFSAQQTYPWCDKTEDLVHSKAEDLVHSKRPHQNLRYACRPVSIVKRYGFKVIIYVMPVTKKNSFQRNHIRLVTWTICSLKSTAISPIAPSLREITTCE